MIEKYDPLKGEMLQILDPTGKVHPELEPKLSTKSLQSIYALMVRTRAADAKAMKLQRQGRMGTYGSSLGHEACQVGAAFAMRRGNWLFPYFRDLGLYITLGLPLKNYYLYWMGNEEGMRIPPELNVFPIAVPVGSQIPHAVGAGMAANVQKTKVAVVCTFSDGATSEGDFHEGLNFAGVYNTTNVGMLGGEFATPIINYPEVAILATLKIADRVRVREGRIVVRKVLPLCLSFDHRVGDGGEAARFVNDVILSLENPSVLLVED